MTAAVSADSRQMAAVTMGQEDGSFVSSLALYRLGREERYAECLLPENAVVYDLGTVGGSYCAVTETGLRFVTTGGKLAGVTAMTADTSTGAVWTETAMRRCCWDGTSPAVRAGW